MVMLASLGGNSTDPTAFSIQVSQPDGSPLLGQDQLPRNSNLILPEYRTVEFAANWSGGASGVEFGYALDGGKTTWLPPANAGKPQSIPVPGSAHELPGQTQRWTFYWEPSTPETPGTAVWLGPASLNLTVSAAR